MKFEIGKNTKRRSFVQPKGNSLFICHQYSFPQFLLFPAVMKLLKIQYLTAQIQLFPLELMQMILLSVKSNEVFGRIIKKKKFQIELRGFAPIGMLEYWNYGIMGSGRLAKIQASTTSCKFNEL